MWFSRLVKRGICAAGFLALFLAAVQFTPLPGLGLRFLSLIPAPFTDSPSHILVMSGSMPGLSGLLRTFYAARIAARHPDAEVLLTVDSNPGASGSDIYVDELILRGVDPARIHRLPASENTRQQALHVAAHLAEQPHPSPRILIVTSPAHIRRTAACIRKVCPARLAACPRRRSRPSDGTPPDPAETLIDESGPMLLRYGIWDNAAITLDILRECTALLYYRFRGWI
ncbi:MAG: YdcF family protein [Lentisphaerae bacterium]|nr:YdcF family protein [Lentisphaerota bacterium]